MIFIELTQKDNGNKALVNLNQATMILDKTSYSTVCFQTENNFIDVKETIETMKERVRAVQNDM